MGYADGRALGRGVRAGGARGLPVAQLIEGLVDQGVPEQAEPTGKRVQFPIFQSRNPGSRKITKKMIDQAELEDDMARSGLSD